MFTFHIHIKVKFRALFIDFGTVEKKFQVGYASSPGFTFSEFSGETPQAATKIMDQRGVVVKVW